MTDGPSLQIDDDWKNQARAEKERLAQKQREKEEAAAKKSLEQAARQKPEADTVPEITGFDGLVRVLASRAVMAMGASVDPQTGRPLTDLDAAGQYLALLETLQQKTKGNLTADEQGQLAGVLYELRDSWVRVAWQSRSTAI